MGYLFQQFRNPQLLGAVLLAVTAEHAVLRRRIFIKQGLVTILSIHLPAVPFPLIKKAKVLRDGNSSRTTFCTV